MPDPPGLRLPPDATDDEAAAIAAALERWLTEEGQAGGPRSGDPWAGRRFAFAARLEKVTGRSVRVPPGVPADPWAAVDRLARQ